MGSREAVVTVLREALERRPEVLEAYVFGSFARAEEQPHSDLDVAVYSIRGRWTPPDSGSTPRSRPS